MIRASIITLLAVASLTAAPDVSFPVAAEGNYRVTVRPAEGTGPEFTAELRRRMAGRTFVVNVRRPEIAGTTDSVRLKDREKASEARAWDGEITIGYTGTAAPQVEIVAAPELPTLFLVGDSTVTDQPGAAYASWGQMITRHFGTGIGVANHSESGESLRSFLGERRWAKILSVIRPGDFVMIQMGHNDQKLADLPGYKTELQRFVREAREHKSTPILVTSMHRRNFDASGRIVNTLGEYPETVRQVAREEKVALIDLNAMSVPLYESWGPEESVKAFAPKDLTHHSPFGAAALARLVAGSIRAQNLPLSKYLNPPTIFVAGDSTANNVNHRGWGDPFSAQAAGGAKVVNRARAGRSSRTFLSEGLWGKMMDEVDAGNFVLIQFGHNDGGPLDTGRARGSLPGIGEETKDGIHTYGWYLRKFIADVRLKGATPVLVTLTVRNIWKDGKVERGNGRFNGWMAEVAKTENVPLADATRVIADRYEKLGETAVKAFFPEDYAHTSPEGAVFNARAVAAALRELPGDPLAQWVNDGRTKVILIGDSTVRNGQGDGRNGQWGWGEPLAAMVDPEKQRVVNKALGGRSSRTFLTGGQWDGAAALIGEGDVVLIQFGHNDASAVNDKERARGTIRGVGDETQEIDNLLTGQHEIVHSYGWYLRYFIDGIRAKGGKPVLVTPIPRMSWKDGKIGRSPYAGWTREVAKSAAVPLIDLEEKIAARYEELGPAKVEPLFHGDTTHTSREGAEMNARFVADALNSGKLGIK